MILRVKSGKWNIHFFTETTIKIAISNTITTSVETTRATRHIVACCCVRPVIIGRSAHSFACSCVSFWGTFDATASIPLTRLCVSCNHSRHEL